MKKTILIFTVVCLVLTSLTPAALAYRELDYSCFEGMWEWSQETYDSRYKLASAELNILQCNAEYITFEFYGTAYHYVSKFSGFRAGIYNSSVSVKNDDGHTLNLYFSENGIYFETDIKDSPKGNMEKIGGFTAKTNEVDYARDISMCVSGYSLNRIIASVNGFDMLPILDVAGELGFNVVFNDREYTLTNDIISYTFRNGDPSVTVSTGEWCGLDIVPQYIKGRFMIPAKFFTDVFGYFYAWDAGTDTVFINSETEYYQTISDNPYIGEWVSYSGDLEYMRLVISEITDEYIVAYAEKTSGKAVKWNIGKAMFIDAATAVATGTLDVPAYESSEACEYKIELLENGIKVHMAVDGTEPVLFTRK